MLEKKLLKKEQEPYDKCSVEGYNIMIARCDHPEDMMIECCHKSPNSELCLVYKRCQKCGIEMPFHDIVGRCTICKNDKLEMRNSRLVQPKPRQK